MVLSNKVLYLFKISLILSDSMINEKSPQEEIEPNIYKIDKLVEKPPLRVAPSNLAIMGRYVLTPDIFDCIENVEPGYGGEIQLTDALSKLDEIYGQVFKGQSYDIGNRIDWLKTSLKFALEDEKAKDDILNFIKDEII